MLMLNTGAQSHDGIHRSNIALQKAESMTNCDWPAASTLTAACWACRQMPKTSDPDHLAWAPPLASASPSACPAGWHRIGIDRRLRSLFHKIKLSKEHSTVTWTLVCFRTLQPPNVLDVPPMSPQTRHCTSHLEKCMQCSPKHMRGSGERRCPPSLPSGGCRC